VPLPSIPNWANCLLAINKLFSLCVGGGPFGAPGVAGECNKESKDTRYRESTHSSSNGILTTPARDRIETLRRLLTRTVWSLSLLLKLLLEVDRPTFNVTSEIMDSISYSLQVPCGLMTGSEPKSFRIWLWSTRVTLVRSSQTLRGVAQTLGWCHPETKPVPHRH